MVRRREWARVFDGVYVNHTGAVACTAGVGGRPAALAGGARRRIGAACRWPEGGRRQGWRGDRRRRPSSSCRPAGHSHPSDRGVQRRGLDESEPAQGASRTRRRDGRLRGAERRRRGRGVVRCLPTKEDDGVAPCRGSARTASAGAPRGAPGDSRGCRLRCVLGTGASLPRRCGATARPAHGKTAAPGETGPLGRVSRRGVPRARHGRRVGRPARARTCRGSMGGPATRYRRRGRR